MRLRDDEKETKHKKPQAPHARQTAQKTGFSELSECHGPGSGPIGDSDGGAPREAAGAGWRAGREVPKSRSRL